MLARIRDTEIFFEILGSSLAIDGERVLAHPTAFVSHGGPGAEHSVMRPGMDPLSEYSQVVFWDHRGQGRSARGDISKYTLDENVEDMEALRQYRS